jgi:hypothetical protein
MMWSLPCLKVDKNQSLRRHRSFWSSVPMNLWTTVIPRPNLHMRQVGVFRRVCLQANRQSNTFEYVLYLTNKPQEAHYMN